MPRTKKFVEVSVRLWLEDEKENLKMRKCNCGSRDFRLAYVKWPEPISATPIMLQASVCFDCKQVYPLQ